MGEQQLLLPWMRVPANAHRETLAVKCESQDPMAEATGGVKRSLRSGGPGKYQVSQTLPAKDSVYGVTGGG